MTDTKNWDEILNLGAAIAEETEMRAGRPEHLPHILASALAWALLREFWGGEKGTVLRRWQNDIPDAMGRYAERIVVEKRVFTAR